MWPIYYNVFRDGNCTLKNNICYNLYGFKFNPSSLPWPQVDDTQKSV